MKEADRNNTLKMNLAKIHSSLYLTNNEETTFHQIIDLHVLHVLQVRGQKRRLLAGSSQNLGSFVRLSLQEDVS